MTAQNWIAFVRARLRLRGLTAARELEIVEEVAQQLDEAFAEALRRGASDAQAKDAAEQHVPDWAAFAGEVERREKRNGQSLGARANDELLRTRPQGGMGQMLSDFAADAIQALRGLRKNRAFALAALATLAIGIGANVTIFSVADAIVFRPLPFPQPEHLVVIWNEYEGKPSSNSPPDYLDRQQMAKTLEGIAAFDERQADLTGRGEPVRLAIGRATASLLPVLGVQPVLGRNFSAEEDISGGPPVALLSYESFQSRFGGDDKILGAAITLNGIPRTIIGVLPRGFRVMASEAEAWVPLSFTPAQLADSFRGNEYLTVIARVREGVAMQAVETEMDAIAASVLERVPGRRAFLSRVKWAASVVPMHEQMVGAVRPAVLTVFFAVGLLLLMACVNVANLTLARATARRKEISTRIALGASPGRLARLLFTESLVLAAAGGALGLAIAAGATRMLAAAAITGVPRLEEVSIHASTLAYTAAVVLLTAVVFGFAPMRLMLRGDLAGSLKERSDSAGRGPRMWMNRALVTAQLGMALLVLVGAGLLLRTFQNLMNTHPGFAAENRVTFRMAMPATRYPDAAARTAFVERLAEHLRSLPGVAHAGFVQRLPLAGVNDTSTFRIFSESEPGPGERPLGAELRTVSIGYLQALGVPLVEGRHFDARDATDAPLVAIVDKQLAEKRWPGESAVGKRLSFGGTNWREVVGVVGSVKNAGLDAPSGEQIYLPQTQNPQNSFWGVLAVQSAGGNWRSTIAAAVQQLDPAMPIDDVRTLEERIATFVAPRKHVSTLLGIFGGVGLLLAASGLYGLMSYLAGQRTQEFAIRVAMGAEPRDVLRLVLRQSAQMVAGGVALGLLAGLALTRVIEKQLYGVAATDWATYSAAALALAIVALAATAVPAMRATRVDPLTALRSE